MISKKIWFTALYTMDVYMYVEIYAFQLTLVSNAARERFYTYMS